jgi:hypothetical protein
MAIGNATFTDIGGGISDLFAASADRSKAAGDLLEGQEYDLAARYADQEAAFTKESTAIQEMQAQRQMYSSMSQTRADVAGAGFSASGSALDILAQSAGQGALQQAVLARQGLITEAGYEEQAQSYRMMESAADMVASAEKKASFMSDITGGIKIAAGVASLFTGGGITSLLGGPGGPQLGGVVGMTPGEGGGFLGGFGGAG